MTETRCEPPPELRGVDGWHWVQVHDWPPRLAEWQVAPHDGRQPLWKDYERQRSATPDWAAREWGYRYLSPVLTPAEVAALRAEMARLREALGRIAEGDHPEGTSLAVNGNYRELEARLRAIARAALNPEPAP